MQLLFTKNGIKMVESMLNNEMVLKWHKKLDFTEIAFEINDLRMFFVW